MKLQKIRKIADRVVDDMISKSNFTAGVERTDPQTVIDKLYKGLTLPKEDKELLDVIISLKLDNTVSNVRGVVTDVIQIELKPIKEDIIIIKEEIGLNGKDKT